jgi:hypothetical protein
MKWLGVLALGAVIVAIALWDGDMGASGRTLEAGATAGPRALEGEELEAHGSLEPSLVETQGPVQVGTREAVPSPELPPALGGEARVLLTGTLLDFQGQAMSKARLRFNDRWAGRRVKTGEAGEFEVELSPGLDPRSARADNPNRESWVEGKGFELDLERSRFERSELESEGGCERWSGTFYAMAPAFHWSFKLRTGDGQPAIQSDCDLSVLVAALEPGDPEEWLLLRGTSDGDGVVEFELDGRHAISDWALLAQAWPPTFNDIFLDGIVLDAVVPEAALVGPEDFYRAPEAQRVLRQAHPGQMDVQLAEARWVRVNVSTREGIRELDGRMTVRRDGRMLQGVDRFGREVAARYQAVLPPGTYELALEWSGGAIRREVQVELVTPQEVEVQDVGVRDGEVRSLAYPLREVLGLDFGPELEELLGPVREE